MAPPRSCSSGALCIWGGRREGLGLAYAIHGRATAGAGALGGRPAVLQGYLLRVAHLLLGSTLKAVSSRHVSYLPLEVPFCAPLYLFFATSIPIFPQMSRGIGQEVGSLWFLRAFCCRKDLNRPPEESGSVIAQDGQ